jgi:hypothetical protein
MRPRFIKWNAPFVSVPRNENTCHIELSSNVAICLDVYVILCIFFLCKIDLRAAS